MILSVSNVSITYVYIFKRYYFIAERIKDEHEKFLLSFETPRLMNIPQEKIVRWHPEFDVESCKKIEQAVLPQPPCVEKPTARDVLGKSYSIDGNRNFVRKKLLFYCYYKNIYKN